MAAGDFLSAWRGLNVDTEPAPNLPRHHKQVTEIISQSSW